MTGAAGSRRIMKIPLLDLELNPPNRSSLAWYGGVATMAGLGLVEWPLAAILVTGHLIAENSRSQAVSAGAEGASAEAG